MHYKSISCLQVFRIETCLQKTSGGRVSLCDLRCPQIHGPPISAPKYWDYRHALPHTALECLLQQVYYDTPVIPSLRWR